MVFKNGVTLQGMHYLIHEPLFDIMEPAFNAYGVEMVVTCTLGGEHSKRSYHPFGLAVDLRRRHLTDEKAVELAGELKRELREHDNRFDVVLERDHFHVELDIRRPHRRRPPMGRRYRPDFMGPPEDLSEWEEGWEIGGEEGGSS